MAPAVVSAHDINFAWLVRLRWGFYVGQAVLVTWMDLGLGMHVPVPVIVGLLVLGLVSNVALTMWQRRGGRASEVTLQAVMLFDTVLLTLLLALTGGPFNPFSALYLVHVVLGVLLLSRARAWAQLAVSFLAFASLFWWQGQTPPAGLRVPSHAELMRLHLAGMLVAFAVSASFVVHYVGRVQVSLRKRDEELERARVLAARNEKLAALTTLAAGAAHELATPLGTIAVVAKELERALEVDGVPAGVRDDAQLIRAQVERCRTILQGMSASSGELVGEGPARFTVAQWVDAAKEGLAAAARVKMPEPLPAELTVEGPRAALAQALRNLLKNALEAGEGDVELRVRQDGAQVTLEVHDGGSGIPAEVLARVGEPFFTTKTPGQGMGLGVFLARAVAEHLGGGLKLESKNGDGTTARLWLPLHPGAAS